MIKEIIKDEAILSQVCEPATPEDAEIAQDLVDTLLASEDAAALAANQIGVTKCIIAYLDTNERPHVMYNPVLKTGMRPSTEIEYCLSREEAAPAKRYAIVTVAYDELVDGAFVPRKKKLTGWLAQVVQHMVDHCKGILI